MTDSLSQAVIFPAEAESMVESLESFDLEAIGSPVWHKQHGYLEKLNMQAVLSAQSSGDEFVKEFLITHGKLPLLIHDLIATELWREKIFARMIEMKCEPKLTFPIYAILYHEATVVTLLETVLYHSDAMETLEDSALDLADYCYRRLCYLVGPMKVRENREEQVDLKNNKDFKDGLEELQAQSKVITFEIAIKAVSLLRYFTDHASCLPLGVGTRLLNTYDIPVLLEDLIEDPPWVVEKKGQVHKYVDNGWRRLETASDSLKLSRTEGQMWIALYQLLLGSEYQQKYDLTSYRKNVLLKLRAHLSEVTVDQMPALIELRRFLEHLNLMDPPPSKRDLILEQLPEIREGFLTKYNKRWQKLTDAFIHQLSSSECEAEMRRAAQSWSNTYNLDVMEQLIAEPAKCAKCGAPAAKRCSRCRNEWYCRRECQVSHWAKHKPLCNLLKEAAAAAGDSVPDS